MFWLALFWQQILAQFQNSIGRSIEDEGFSDWISGNNGHQTSYGYW